MTTTARTDPRTYRFGTFTLDASTGALSRDGRAVALTAQPTRMLLYLVRHAGRLVVREELIEHLWPDRVVEYDQGLAFCVRRIRAVLGDRARAPVFLETVPGQGYRFVAPVARTGGRSRRWADRRRLRTVLAMCLSGLAGAVLSAALASPPADEPATRPWLATALPAAADGPAAAARATHQIGGEYYRRNPDLRAARFAADLFEHAATLDTLFVEAHAMHAVARATLSWEFGGGAELDRARDALSRAMRLDSGAPATRLAEGYLRYYGERDYSGALEALADARSGAPTLPDPVVGRAYVLRRQGHWREALSDLEYALELDPRRFRRSSRLR